MKFILMEREEAIHCVRSEIKRNEVEAAMTPLAFHPFH